MALAGCAATAETAVEPLTPVGESGTVTDVAGDAIPEQCDADTYRPLIGTPIATSGIVAGPRLRAFGRKDIITQEYIPQRTNVVTSDDGTILRAYCG